MKECMYSKKVRNEKIKEIFMGNFRLNFIYFWVIPILSCSFINFFNLPIIFAIFLLGILFVLEVLINWTIFKIDRGSTLELISIILMDFAILILNCGMCLFDLISLILLMPISVLLLYICH